MALNNTYFESNKVYEPLPIPEQPGYIPPSPPTPPTPGSGSIPDIVRPSYTSSTVMVLYNNTSDAKCLNKNITEISSYPIDIKDDMNTDHPVVLLNGIINCNYAKILDRYYYVTCECMPGNITKLICAIDSLMTHRESILSHNAIIKRGNQKNTYLSDDKMKITSYKTTHALKFSGAFSKNLKYYLLTTGNGTAVQGGE